MRELRRHGPIYRFLAIDSTGIRHAFAFVVSALLYDVKQRASYRAVKIYKHPLSAFLWKGSASNVSNTPIRDVRLLGTSVSRRVELMRSKLHSGTVGPGAILPSGHRPLSSRHLPLTSAAFQTLSFGNPNFDRWSDLPSPLIDADQNNSSTDADSPAGGGE